MQLNHIDKKLLTYLYHSYRNPLTEIAKACRISRDQVEYRLRKYEREGIIKKYLTIFNYSLLGFNEFSIVWFKTKGNIEELKKYLQEDQNVISFCEVLSTYSIFVNFISRDKRDFEEALLKLFEGHSETIENYKIATITHAEFFPLKIFGDKTSEKSFSFLSSEENALPNNNDLKILHLLEKEGRERIIDMAKKTGLSSENVIYKLRNLRKNKIILGNRIQFDMEKLGFYFASLKLELKNLNLQFKNRLISFSKSHNNINAIAFGISEYNCIIQLLYQTENQLRKTIKDIRSEFGDIIQSDILLILGNESMAKTLPSLL